MTASSGPATVGVPRQSAAFGRKLLYCVSHVVFIDSFEPLKRAFDVIFATVVLVVASPFLFCLILRRKVGGRPVLTRDERVGRYGRRYTQYGITGFERRRRLQRLPLLLNILAGDMSLIGPRPAAPGDPIVEGSGRARLSVRPGVICSWWLRRHGNIDFDGEAAADSEYVNTASLSADLGIALRAVPALVFSEEREAAPRTVEILGIRMDNMNLAEALEWIRRRLDSDSQAVVSVTNAHRANRSCLDDAYHRSLLASDLNLAGGVGLRIAGKLKRTPIRQNVNESDLFPRLCAMLADAGRSVYLLGGRQDVAQNVAAWIGKQYPATVVAGYRDGYFEPSEEATVTEEIRRSGASVLLVAAGVPEQELWIRRNLGKTGVRVALSAEGLFDFYSGQIPRAPVWLREIGLEWVWCLLREPGLMWRRYLIGSWIFLARHLLYEMNVYRPHSPGLGISGVPLDNLSMQGALNRIEEFIDSGGTHQVATANVDFLVNATRDLEYRRILCQCDLVLPDGMPVVWASHLLGAPLRERVTGADLVPRLARLSSEKGYRIFLLGATPTVCEVAARRMETLAPGVRVVGNLSPPIRPLDQFDNAPILEAIRRAKPDILLVAFGSPKQEKWISRNRNLLNVPVAIGIGGSLDFLASSVKRAPSWMQTSGLEWIHRIWMEPRRLGPRYLGDAVWLMRYLPVELLTSFSGRLRYQELRLSLDIVDAVRIVRVGGSMAGSALVGLGEVFSTAAASGGPVVLDLAETSHIGADGLWALAGLIRKACERNCELWLAGLSPPLRRTLRASHFEGVIRSAVSVLEAVRQISAKPLTYPSGTG